MTLTACTETTCIREGGHSGRHVSWGDWVAKNVPHGARYARADVCPHPDDQREYVAVQAFQSTCRACETVALHPSVGGASPTLKSQPAYEEGHRAALIMASKRIRALPKVHGPDIAISDEALSEREAIADFLDELSS